VERLNYKVVLHCATYKSEKLETTQVPNERGLTKQIAKYPENRTIAMQPLKNVVENI
jgi:hypothetical protein